MNAAWTQGGLRVETSHFHSWSVGIWFYPVFNADQDDRVRATGERTPASQERQLLGKMSSLEVHHFSRGLSL